MRDFLTIYVPKKVIMICFPSLSGLRLTLSQGYPGLSKIQQCQNHSNNSCYAYRQNKASFGHNERDKNIFH